MINKVITVTAALVLTVQIGWKYNLKYIKTKEFDLDSFITEVNTLIDVVKD